MSLNNFNLLKESDSHFEISSPNGKSFKVKKDDLSARAQEIIKKMKRMSEDSKEEFYDGGMSSEFSPDLTTMQAMPLPNRTTKAESDKTMENRIAAEEGEGLETPLIAPDELLLGGVIGSGEAGLNAAKAVGKEVLNSEAGRIGTGAARNYLQMAQDIGGQHLEKAKILPAEQQQALSGMFNNALMAVKEHLGPDTIKALERMDPEQAMSKLSSFPEMRQAKQAVQNYINRFTSGNVGSVGGDILRTPRMAEGGEISDEAPLSPPLEDTSSSNFYLDKMDSAEPELPADSLSQTMPPVQTPPSTQDMGPMAAMTGTQIGSFTPYTDSLEAVKKAQLDAAKAVGAEGAAESLALQGMDQQLRALPTQKDIINKNAQKDSDLFKSYQEAKIEPGRFFHNLSTGNKILAGIGVLLSGLGSGLSGKENLAVQVVDDAINKDIDAQKNDQSNKYNLWKMNRERLGDDLSANLATRNQMYTDVKYQLMKAASQFKGPQAMAAAAAANAKIDQELAQNRFLQSVLTPTTESTAGSEPGSEQAFINHNNALRSASGMSPLIAQLYKENQSKYIPNIGVAKIAPTPADRTELMGYTDLTKAIDNALVFQQTGPGANVGAWSPASRKVAAGLQGNIITSMGPMLYNIKRFSPDLAAKFEERVKNPGSFDLFGANAAALKQLKADVQQRQSTLQNQLGVQPFSKQSLPTTMMRDGVKYIKVPGGWQKSQ